MIRKKICMLGGFAVGKTSLVARYVHGHYSDKYLTTVGVKIDQHAVRWKEEEVQLVLWDVHGEDDFQKVQRSYLRGSSGFLLVIDGTRGETVEKALRLHERAVDTLGEVPFLCLVNKCDLAADWEVTPSDLEALERRGWKLMQTSALSGEAVEQAFQDLSSAMMELHHEPS